MVQQKICFNSNQTIFEGTPKKRKPEKSEVFRASVLASDIRRSINERSCRLEREDHCEGLDERGPDDCVRRHYRMPQQTFEKLPDILRLQPLRDRPFPRTLLGKMMMSCTHNKQCFTGREWSIDYFALPAYS